MSCVDTLSDPREELTHRLSLIPHGTQLEKLSLVSIGLNAEITQVRCCEQRKRLETALILCMTRMDNLVRAGAA